MSDVACRGCAQSDPSVFLSLGKVPLANALLTADLLHEPESRYPLEVALCESCALVQLTATVAPEEMFEEYAYFSSTSSTMVEHARVIAGTLIERGLSPDDLVIELASNDGYLLQHYQRAGIPVLGIDPAANVAAVAQDKGIETLVAFFGIDLARSLVAQGTRASVVHANNVLAHVPDLNGFVAGIAHLLRDDGVAVIETPYVRDLVERLEFDTIYHEHVFYHSLTGLHRIFERNGLTITSVERIPIHGGSLRVFASLAGATTDASVATLLAEERGLGLGRLDYFQGFAARVDASCARLRVMLAGLKAEGRRIVAYGAAAKGAVLLNASGIGAETIEYVCDRNDYKQGRFMPGVRIPIVSPDRLLLDMPDDVLLLVWNIAGEVLDQESEYRARGGRFIVPMPEPRFV